MVIMAAAAAAPWGDVADGATASRRMANSWVLRGTHSYLHYSCCDIVSKGFITDAQHLKDTVIAQSINSSRQNKASRTFLNH